MTPFPVPYLHPQHQRPLVRVADGFQDPATGEMFCVVRGIPRFCAPDNYSESFGFQWNQFDRTQLDVHSGADLSQQRFYAETGWGPLELSNWYVRRNRRRYVPRWTRTLLQSEPDPRAR